jgi:hypothetical protein
MFLNRNRRFGQYSAEDIELAPSGDVWSGSTYDPGMTPASWVTSWVSTAPSSSGGSNITSGILPVLNSILSAGAQVGSAYLGLQAAKEKAAAVPVLAAAATTPAGYTRTATGQLVPITPTQAGILGGMSWPIIGIIAIGAFLVLRGGKGPSAPRRRR